jgi:hypothetical protein
MEATAKPPRPSRMRLLLQPAIIRVYKGAGIIALGAILLGLVAFVVVNVFYFFDESWVRPQILSPNHEKVIAAVSAEADAQLQRSELDSARLETEAELTQHERLIATAAAFETDVGELAALPPTDPQSALLRREVDRVRLERQAATDRLAGLQRRIKDLDTRIAEQDEIIARLRSSPYLKAAEGRVVVAFAPYDNLETVRPGAALYGCAWGLVRCSRVGQVGRILDGEVQDSHPHDNKPMRGVLVEIDLTNPRAAESGVLFADDKPFWLF